jgi:hypothetical protein
MGGHEPPTNRSFYFSLGTSTLRSAVIIALVVGGALLINQAFQGAGSEQPGGGPISSVSPTPSPTPSSTPSGQESPPVAGVRIAVFNGTQSSGLAADTAKRLRNRYNYQIAQTPANAPGGPVAQTTIYFRTAADKDAAQALADNFFTNLDVKVAQLPATATNVDPSVQVAIYLGNDYVASRK